MKADRDNAIRYLGFWVAAVASVWSVLMLYGKENPWIDRVITGEIAICALLSVLVIFWYTPKWSVRTIGVFSLMAAIVLLYTASQALDAGVFGPPFHAAELPPGAPHPPTIPYWWRSLWRSMLAVAGPCLLWGFYHWWQFETDREP